MVSPPSDGNGMTHDNILDACQASIDEHGYIAFEAEAYPLLDAELVTAIQQRFGGKALMQLPPQEIEFFEWLKQVDPAVWNDLWEGDHLAPYLVSIAHLSNFAGENAIGIYPICDLQTHDNYYFAPQMFHAKESSAYMAAVRSRFDTHLPLSPAQILALEASMGPVDIWHFAYRRGLGLDVMKKAVATLVDDGILVHVPKVEHLIELFDVQ
ncbi:MAG: hypothetical protein EHM43_03110 [Ignavibacteriae bacterium]|nr:MAG: hypothetical protein EHM43_03110 [Ignavibacteriota bacterium]